jgi:hypothetical protein
MPHAEFIGALRENAAGMNRSQKVVRNFATLLESYDILTPDEADWLAAAGPAWHHLASPDTHPDQSATDDRSGD